MTHCPSGDPWWVALLRVWYWDQSCLTSLLATWTVGLSVPSASLLMTPSCVVWLTLWREGMPSRGIRTGLRTGPVQTSWSSTRPSERSCTCIGEYQTQMQAGWRVVWEQPWREELGGVSWQEAQLNPAMSAHRRPTVSRAASKKAWPAGQGRWFCPSTLLWWDLTWSSV